MNNDINKIVTKSNKIIQANYFLTPTEQKILLYFVAQIQKDDKEFKEYVISAKTFCELIGMTSRPRYSEIKKVTGGLFGKYFEIKVDENKFDQVPLLHKVRYNTKKGTISLVFHDEMKPFLLELKREFTSYRLFNILELKSGHSIRIFELLKQWELVGEVTFTIEDLKAHLGVSDKYREYSNLKKKAILVAYKELKEKTDIYFEFEEIKNSRKVEKIKFKIYKQENANSQLTLFDSSLINGVDSLYTRINDLVSKYGYYVEKKTVIRWEQLAKKKWEKDSENKLLYLIDEVNHNTEVNNPIGYITTILKSKEDLSNFVGKKRLTKEEKRRQLMLGKEEDVDSSEEVSTEVPAEEREKRKAKLLSMLEN